MISIATAEDWVWAGIGKSPGHVADLMRARGRDETALDYEDANNLLKLYK